MIARPDRFLALNFYQFLCGFGIAAGIHNDPQVPLHLQAMRWTPSNCQMDAVWMLLWWQQVPVRKKLAKALKTNRLLECHKLDLFGISFRHLAYSRTLRRLNPSVGNRTSSCYPTRESERSPWHFSPKNLQLSPDIFCWNLSYPHWKLCPQLVPIVSWPAQVIQRSSFRRLRPDLRGPWHGCTGYIRYLKDTSRHHTWVLDQTWQVQTVQSIHGIREIQWQTHCHFKKKIGKVVNPVP